MHDGAAIRSYRSDPVLARRRAGGNPLIRCPNGSMSQHPMLTAARTLRAANVVFGLWPIFSGRVQKNTRIHRTLTSAGYAPMNTRLPLKDRTALPLTCTACNGLSKGKSSTILG